MMRLVQVQGVMLAIALLASPAWGQTAVSPAPPGEAPPAREPAAQTEVDPDRVAVTVNGRKITEGEVDETLRALLKAQGATISDEQFRQIREQNRGQLLNLLVESALFDEDIKEAGIEISEKELLEEAEEQLGNHLKATNQRRSDFASQVQQQRGMSLDEFLKQYISNPMFKWSVLQTRLIEKKYPEDLKVTDEDVRKYYEEHKEDRYSTPEMVRASHVLVDTRGLTTEDEKQEARAKAEKVLEEARKPDADFAELAREHSACPSKAQGGDLNFFPRRGAMVEPFAAAAYALKPGEISGVVETQFGYHIIKVTERQEADVTPFDEVKEAIENEVEGMKVQEVREKHLAARREQSRIVFATADPATRPAVEPVTPSVDAPPSE